MGKPVFRGDNVVNQPTKMRSYANPHAYKPTPHPEAREKHLPKWLVKLIILVGLVIFILWFLFDSSFFQVKNIQIKGQASSQTKLAINELYGKNIFLIGGKKAEDNLSAKEPGIKNINILRGIPGTVVIDLVERKPAIVWETENKDYLVDNDGYVYRNSDGKYPKVVDNQNVPVVIGGRISTSSFVNFILNINEHLNSVTGFTIDHIEVPETTYQVNIITKDGPVIKMDTSRSLSQQLTDIKYISDHYKDGSHNMIDVRVSGFAYIK